MESGNSEEVGIFIPIFAWFTFGPTLINAINSANKGGIPNISLRIGKGLGR